MLSGGWALRLRLQRSALGKGLGLAVRRQPEGLGSSVTQPREPGRRSGPAEKQVTTVGEDKRRWGGLP